jgi:DNA-binding response OmpR family regulator
LALAPEDITFELMPQSDSQCLSFEANAVPAVQGRITKMSAWNPSELRVMIIDDQAAARGMLKKMLKDMHINQVYEAGNGRDGLKMLDAAPDMVDLVICDWNMPTITGIDLLRQVRSVGFDIPFLMLTGRADADSVVEARDAGVSGYIAKPFSRDQLEAKLRIVMSKRKQAAAQ